MNSKKWRIGPEVRSAPNEAVDSTAITPMQMSTGIQALTHSPRRLRSRRESLLDMVVGRFAGDDYVVDMALAQTCAGDADETGILLEFVDGAAAKVAHT